MKRSLVVIRCVDRVCKKLTCSEIVYAKSAGALGYAAGCEQGETMRELERQQ
jgi:hypothetical protein